MVIAAPIFVPCRLALGGARVPRVPSAVEYVDAGVAGCSTACLRSLLFLKVASTCVSAMKVAAIRDGSALAASDVVAQTHTLLGLDPDGHALRVDAPPACVGGGLRGVADPPLPLPSPTSLSCKPDVCFTVGGDAGGVGGLANMA